MTKNILIILLIMFSLGTIGVPSIRGSENHPAIVVSSVEDAERLKEQLGIDAVIIFVADWCGFCKVLKSDLYTDPSITNNKIICYIDYDTNKKLAEKMKVKTIPHSIILGQSKTFIGYQKEKYKKWIMQ